MATKPRTQLKEYRQKRSFQKTPEPEGRERKKKRSSLIFVVQKHSASHLHYDFRLEWNGVLKSWAVPKEPSADPQVKRLAVHVEDHPYDYRNFEGVIPAGQYGAGIVEIWDDGDWIPVDDPEQSYKKGKIRFELRGKKLRGYWVLLRMHGKTEGKNWLLIKEKENSSSVSIQKKPVSQADSPPEFIEPQLATLVDEVPSGASWLHEIKFDGYRALTRLDRGVAQILTRNRKDWTARFPEIAAEIEKLPLENAFLDGEVVKLSEQGISSFQALQNALSEEQTEDLYYYIFDIFYLNGEDLRNLSLEQRRSLLKKILARRGKNSRLRFSDSIQGPAKKFYASACQNLLEGIVSKRKDLPYEPGRSGSWLKNKCLQRQEFVICGFTAPQGSRGFFGSLVLGVYDDKKLRYAGLVGTGFSQKSLKELHAKLLKIKTDKPLFPVPRLAKAKKIEWVKPELAAEVSFSEWTQDKVLRQPAFHGLREDKPTTSISLEKPVKAKRVKTVAPGVDKAELSGEDMAGVRLTHPDKILYEEQGITKRELAAYYENVADKILPHLKNRPLSLVRCPGGEQKQCFYQKHVAENILGQLATVEITGKEGVSHYPVVNDLAGLISLVQIGVLEIHPWGSRAENLEQPDRLIFDLDPDAKVTWEKVRETAKLLKLLLTELGLKSFLKTTGGKGLHVVVPFAKKQDWPTVKAFSKAVVQLIVKDNPKDYTIEMSKSKRGGKIFLDYFRNDRGSTAVSPYSTRAKAGASVSTPIFWDELSGKIKSDHFTVRNLPRRLAGLHRDPWQDFFTVRQSLTPALGKPWIRELLK